MKYCIIFIFSCVSFFSYAVTDFEKTIADTLASKGIIVQQNNPENYRLHDPISRQEAIGMVLKLTNITLPENYFCQNYFRDVAYVPGNNWVCRAIETAADAGIVSRNNQYARPLDIVSRSEALGLIFVAKGISYEKNIARGNLYSSSIQQWQVDIIEAAFQMKFLESRDINPDRPATRLEVLGIIYNILSLEAGAIPVETEKSLELVAFDTTLSMSPKLGTPFDIIISAKNNNASILENYTGKIYIDVVSGPENGVKLPVSEYIFSADEKGRITIKNVIISTPGTYELDIYEVESGYDITKTLTITVQ